MYLLCLFFVCLFIYNVFLLLVYLFIMSFCCLLICLFNLYLILYLFIYSFCTCYAICCQISLYSTLYQPTSMKPNYPGHVPLNCFQRAFMFVGSGIAAAINPRRPDLIATFGEMTVQPFFITRLRDLMLQDSTGRQILRERPRITSKSLDLDKLRALPPTTVGHVYTQWLDREGVSPDTRLPVKFIDDEECAYVMQRYRECHDFYHAITGLPVWMEGEVAVKAFEFANLGIPMTGLAALFEPTQLNTAQRQRLKDIFLPWAISNGLKSKLLLNVYWEKVLDYDASKLRAELGIDMPPDMRSMRKKKV